MWHSFTAIGRWTAENALVNLQFTQVQWIADFPQAELP